MHMLHRSPGVILVLLLSILVASPGFAGIVPADRISVYFSREQGNLEETLVSLYGDVQKGGYIWVITSSLTHPAIFQALIDAKRRGVDVRLISDKGKLENKRNEVAMYNLKLQGISIKVNRFSGAMRLQASVVDNKWVVVGSYEYGSTRTALGLRVDEEDLLVIPARVDKHILEEYKNAFERMWNDEKSFQALE